MSEPRRCVLAMAIAAVLAILHVRYSTADETGERSTVRVDFSREVLPLLTRAGCNSGACHGAAAGRGYLQLSLFGSRPTEDFEAIAHSLAGRFLDRSEPSRSLLLQKPSGQLEHGGGERIELDGRDYQTLHRWISELHQYNDRHEPARFTVVDRLQCTSSGPIELAVGESQKVAFQAEFRSQGLPATLSAVHLEWLMIEGAQPATSNTATPLTYKILPGFLELTAHTAGYWPVTIRYANAAMVIQVFVRENADASPSGPAAPKLNNPIDQSVLASGARIGKLPDGRCSPSQLARRLWIDLLGEHPTRAEWEAAEQAIRSGETPRLVQRLLSDPRFLQRSSQEIASWSGLPNSPVALQQDIAKFLKTNDNLREMAQGMLLVQPEPSTLEAFHLLARDARQRSELVASTWLGTRIGCAQCHDHPLDRWTQDDYFGLAACWAEIEISRGRPVRVPGKTTTDLRYGRAATPRLVLGNALNGNQPADVQLVEWITSPENELFARNVANRIWYWLAGRGIVEDLDDFRATNPPINPELMNTLVENLRNNDYSVRSLVKKIVLSDAYARRTTSEKAASQTRGLVVLAATATGNRLALTRTAKPIDIPVHQLVASAFALGDASSPSLEAKDSSGMTMAQTDGCTRAAVCDDPFGQSIDLVKDAELNASIRDGVAKVCAANRGATTQFIASTIHAMFFGEPLTETRLAQIERIAGKQMLLSRQPDRALLEDIAWQWSVSEEFRLLQ